ncbi:LOW QUALITY PROTEIN: transcription factor MYB88-like [Arachis ipaensis]|uniref:LOW QUALITY PROTEIN: transcription factor MYB88-like n=1 Tax=Arachis ipaensis TaxID=130454 RepID=UPI000A2B5C18|nr:LOW QUALITY PROTEIN: transcription factor MYB88-like [Arachis ipaensis]
MKKQEEQCNRESKKKGHIVTWTQEEDDILREQIGIHGTENWAIIASKFKDKTTRQCRRRWYTYLNSDFKKGGWSPEEDLLLCEAQKLYGNRWTEIAKVVRGRQPCWRQMDLYEDSPASSEYSTGSTILPLSAGDIMEHSSHRDIETEMKTTQIEDKKEADGCERGVLVTATLDQDMLLNSEEQINNDSAVSASSRVEFGSPVQVTPIFRSLAAGIPSPEFSESERNFLRKTLGVESPSLNPSAQPSQPPPCKRALLDSLQS